MKAVTAYRIIMPGAPRLSLSIRVRVGVLRSGKKRVGARQAVSPRWGAAIRPSTGLGARRTVTRTLNIQDY